MTLVNAVNTTWQSVQPQNIRGSNKLAALDQFGRPNWDESLRPFPEAGFFHSAAWTSTLESAYGYTPKPFFANDEAGARLFVPLMEVRSQLTGIRGISLPFSDSCEPLVRDSTASSDLCDALLAFGRKQGWKYLECRGGRNIFQNARPSASYYTHILDLGCSEDALWKRCAPATRRAIRKAEMTGVSVEASSASPAAVETYYELHCQTRRKHGLPPQPWSFFEALFEHALSKQSGTIFLARHSGEAVAGAVFVHFGRKAVFKYGASDPGASSLRGNNAVMWEAIRWYARHGFTELNLGRTEIENEGLRRYKLGWRVEERIQNYYRFDYAANEFVVSGETAPSGFTKAVFRWIPPKLARLIGALLYKHVA